MVHFQTLRKKEIPSQNFFKQDNVNCCLRAHVNYSEAHAKCVIIANTECRYKNGLNNLTRLAFKQEMTQAIQTVIHLLTHHATINNRFFFINMQSGVIKQTSMDRLLHTFVAIQRLDPVAPKQNINATLSIK